MVGRRYVGADVIGADRAACEKAAGDERGKEISGRLGGSLWSDKGDYITKWSLVVHYQGGA